MCISLIHGFPLCNISGNLSIRVLKFFVPHHDKNDNKSTMCYKNYIIQNDQEGISFNVIPKNHGLRYTLDMRLNLGEMYLYVITECKHHCFMPK